MTKVVIVGGLGVGMAHAIACEKNGYRVEAVVDINPDEVEKRYNGQSEWVNAWGDVVDTVTVNHKVRVARAIPELVDIGNEVDLVVIAVPDAFHHPMVCDALLFFPKAKVLCEKPAVLDYSYSRILENKDRIYIGYEWLYHPGIVKKLKTCFPKKMAFIHDYPCLDRNIVYDLGSHLLSMIYCSAKEAFKNIAFDLRIILEKESLTAEGLYTKFKVNVCTDLIWKGVSCVVSYKPRDFTDNVAGYRINTKKSKLIPTKQVEVVIDGEGFGWKDDLFQKQLRDVMKSSKSNFEVGKCVYDVLSTSQTTFIKGLLEV